MAHLILAASLALVALHGAPPASAPVQPPERFSGRVVKVLDGDTVDVLWRTRPVRVRLAGVDAPESGQPYGAKAREFVKRATRGRTVTVVGAANDRFERRLGEVLVSGGESLNRALLAHGLAWHFVRYSDDEQLAALERDARTAGLGLWADAAPEAPWEYRADKRAGPTRDAAPAPAEAFVGNRRSRIFHAPGCPDRDRVSTRNRELFASESEALAAGYRRARNCQR
jgi:micrococcal nuclease